MKKREGGVSGGGWGSEGGGQGREGGVCVWRCVCVGGGEGRVWNGVCGMEGGGGRGQRVVCGLQLFPCICLCPL